MKIFFCLLLLLSHKANSEAIVLGLGEKKILPLSANTSEVRVTSRQVVSLKDNGSNLIIVGRKIGQAVVSYANHSYHVEVVAKDTLAAFIATQDCLIDRVGLKTEISKNQIIIRGDLLRSEDWFDLQRCLEPFDTKWQWRVRVNPLIEEEFMELFRARKLKNLGIGWRLQTSPELAIMAPVNVNEKSQLFLSVSRLGFPILHGSLTQSETMMIQMDVTLAEVKRSSLENLGIGFQDGQNLQILPKFQSPDFLEGQLNWLLQKGDVKNVSRAKLISRNRKEVEFQSGGEFAIRTNKHKQTDVSWKKYGLTLKLKPVFEGLSNIELTMTGQISTPDFAQSVEGIPALKMIQLQSSTMLRIGKCHLLARLNIENLGHSQAGPSSISEVPVVGRLFRNDLSFSEDSEFVIFVTPTLIESGEPNGFAE